MNLFQRLRYSIESDLHALFDKKEEKNPIKLLNQYIREAEKQVEETALFLDRQSKLKEKLEKELENTNAMFLKRQQQVELAELSGEQDLIDFATAEMHAYANRAASLEQSIEQSAAELISLERKYEEMKHKIKDMHVRQLQLMGKENVVRAHNRMDTILNSKKQDQRVESFESMEQYIDQLSGKIEMQHEVTSMEQRLAKLENTAEKKA